jgi:hypothetical protein
MLGDFEQVDHTQESGFPRQDWSDVLKTDLLDRIHHDLAFFHAVSIAGFDAGSLPNPDARSDLSPADSVAKPLGENHQRHSPKCALA